MRTFQNLGLADRFIRTLLAIIIGAIGTYYESWYALLALIPLATALAGWCPIYRMAGYSNWAPERSPMHRY